MSDREFIRLQGIKQGINWNSQDERDVDWPIILKAYADQEKAELQERYEKLVEGLKGLRLYDKTSGHNEVIGMVYYMDIEMLLATHTEHQELTSTILDVKKTGNVIDKQHPLQSVALANENFWDLTVDEEVKVCTNCGGLTKISVISSVGDPYASRKCPKCNHGQQNDKN